MTRSTHPSPLATAAPQSFAQCLAYFLTPQVWKQAQQAVPRRRAWRWQTQPLLFVLLGMTWCAGDSLPERFETACAFYVALHQRRRRPGKTFAGFEKALGKLPMPVLRAVATALRGRLAQVFAQRLWVDGFIPLGCDGSRLACPRSQELEQRLVLGKKRKRKRKPKAAPASPASTKPRAASCPQLWVTAVVHLGLGVLWSWRLGTGHANERVRLWRVRGDKGDVYLMTNVLEEQRLPRRTAAKFYRWRWRNEGLFRTYKRTLGKVKLMSRTVAQVHREAEGSLLATQLLLAQGALALAPTASGRSELPSARKVLLEIRMEIRNVTGMYLGPRQRQSYLQRLARARWPQRQQRTSKVRRRWPGRADHKPPGPPKILKMGTILKDKMAKTLAINQHQKC